MAILVRPSTQPRIILAHKARACAVLGRRTHRSRAFRSASFIVDAGFGHLMVTCILLSVHQHGEHFFSITFTMNYSFTALDCLLAQGNCRCTSAQAGAFRRCSISKPRVLRRRVPAYVASIDRSRPPTNSIGYNEPARASSRYQSLALLAQVKCIQ